MILEIRGLKVSYNDIEVVRGIDLCIDKGECVGLVGESGCGKSTIGLSITKLIPREKGRINVGSILLEGKDILSLDPDGLRAIRGRKISYVFQDPFSSLNPVFTIYDQLKEALPGKENTEEVISRILDSVGLSKIAGNKRIYPHELSGGMQQRVMIAMAIASKPDLLVLDEPTTALDVTIQNQILELIMELKNKMRLSVLFISHDLKTIFRLSDRVAIMYAGRIVEDASKENIISQPRHPYTMGLVSSIPSFEHRKERFNAIEGNAPLFSDLPKGCKFHPRCKFRIDRCLKEEPQLEETLGRGASRCIRTKELFSDGAIKST